MSLKCIDLQSIQFVAGQNKSFIW